MKKYLVVILVFFITRVDGQSLSSTVSFEERVHDFGTILEKNGKVSHTFTFKNNGTTPVTINDIHSTCGCVGNIVSKEPVRPGATGKVTITFNPDYKSGFFSKEIIVYSNDGKEFNRIWVQGSVKPAEHPITDEYPYSFGRGLYLRLKVMALGYLKPGESREVELHYANSTNKPMALRFLVDGNHPGLTFTNPGTLLARQRGIVKFSYRMPANSNEDLLIRIHPYVDNKRLSETLDLRVLNERKKVREGISKNTK
jgi:hypothetical protein